MIGKIKMAGKIKIPMRTCIGCNTIKPKKEMIRMVITPEKKCEIDASGKKSGRGFYICYNIECLNNAIKKNRFDKYVDKAVSQKLIKQLEETFHKGNV